MADPRLSAPLFTNYTEMPTRVPPRVWRLAQCLTVAGVLAVALLAFIQPPIALLIFWGALVPLLPLVFLVAPGLWRNICPLAAANQTPRVFGFTRGLALPSRLREYSYVVGLVLFFAIVPARKVLLNQNGPALAALLLAALAAAFVGGTVFQGKSGWCSTFCPLLPVQCLYGQTPFATVRNSHCDPCVGCTTNCYDFNPSVAFLSDMHAADRYSSGYRRFFAGAFPGLILAFYTVPDPPAITPLEMYSRFALYILVGVGCFFALDAFVKGTPNTLPPLFAVAALNLYYWFNIPALAAAIRGVLDLPSPDWLIWAGRAGISGLSVVWLRRTYRIERLFMAQFLPTMPARVETSTARTLRAAAYAGRCSVIFMPGEKRVEIEPGRTLLETAEQCGLAIEAGCRMGVCGADPVAIHQGMGHLSPVSHEERSTLQRLGLAANTRMACRARVHGPVSVALTPERGGTLQPITMEGFAYDPSIQRVVILGNGIAGVTAADHIRRRHPKCEIHLVGREKHQLYNRMGISRLIYGRSAMQGLYLLPDSWYDEYGITCWLNTRAVRIGCDARQVALATGEILAYDRLVLAMGSSSFVPPIEGFNNLGGTFVLRDADDAMQLRAFVQDQNAHRAVVAGGGVLGLEAAYALHKLGLHVTVLERSARLMARQLDGRGSQLLRERLERIGLEIVLNAETARVFGPGELTRVLLQKPALREFFRTEAKGSGHVTQVQLVDGRTLPCDVFLVCAGIRPNVEVARAAGLKVGGGVIVDDSMRTSAPEVLAAGDVAEHRGQVSGLWPPAVAQAEVAAINAVGGGAVYEGVVPETMLKVVGIDLTSVGRTEAASEGEIVISLEDIVGDTGEHRYRKLVISGGKIVGSIVLGYPILAPLVAQAVKQRADVMPYLDVLRAGDWDILRSVAEE